ncbi:MAG TPA: hypothetical protein VHM70_29940 [Polyangiaceae bacterium]|jgi:hypothetical protein|nr:hypothetical protein [Polyangiaceae bacterium]
MSECPHMKRCAMYPLFTLAGTLKTWQIRYCTGEFALCERYQRSLRGQPVPPELMPNGTMLRKSTSRLKVVE